MTASRAQPLQDRLRVLCRSTTELLGCERSRVFVLDRAAMRVAASHGNPTEMGRHLSSFSLSDDAPIVEAVRRRQQVLVIDEPLNSPLVDDLPAAISGLAVAPMWDGRRRLVGMLTAEYDEQGAPFRRVHEELIAGIAHLASIVAGHASTEAVPACEQAGSGDAADVASIDGGPLAPPEMELLQLLCRGCTNEEAARRLHRSIRTIENHRGRIMKKLGATTRADMMSAAADLGIVQFPALPSTNHRVANPDPTEPS